LASKQQLALLSSSKALFGWKKDSPPI